MSALAAIPAELIDMMAGGVSVQVASHDAQRRPSVMRAIGSEVHVDKGLVTVYLSRRQASQLVQDVSATGSIAAVFSEPYSHRTVQVKATRATLRNAQAADEPVLARYLAAMERQVERVGLEPPLTRAMLAYRIEDLVAISFEPEQAFDQTPGATAGAPLGAAR